RAGTIATNERRSQLFHSSFGADEEHDHSECERRAVCTNCTSRAKDTIEHVLFDCDPIQSQRLIERIKQSLRAANADFVVECMNEMQRNDLVLLLMGYTFA